VPFEVLQAPLPAQLLEAADYMDQRRMPWLTAIRIAATVHVQRICLVLYTLALLCGIIRANLIGREQGTWVETALLEPVHVILPILPLTLPFVWIMANL
jgi:hypothetical protein